ncbi:hypothetical protein BDP27DRAFT_462410 [Rhodocollybia butyracea]|uniref:MPN domain-containing protein n=1 Tax=Rhodocollybia butyracea TaxID=206335 RepID=A0A9P5UB91_9AGAR|nr:hypothetical protein BDP27DRAFT_462410 [Rhodocollybia butyracea]
MASNQSEAAHRRPAMISELAARAQQTSWEEDGSFKYFLRLAEKYRKEAKEAVSKGELEEAFIAFARSASIVLEKLPNHRDYNSTLNPSQRHNLSLNGQEILDNLGHLKPVLLDRFDQWSAQHPNGEDSPPPNTNTQATLDSIIQEGALRAQEEADPPRRKQMQPPRQLPPLNSAAASAVQSAKAAAGIPQETGSRNQRQQEEMHARSQELMRRKQEERLRSHAVSPSVTSYNSFVTTPSTSTFTTAATTPTSSLSPSVTMYHSASKASTVAYQPPPVSQPNMYRSQQAPSVLPLENPSRYDDDSTDSEHDNWSGPQNYSTPVKPTRPNYPAPVTTTSPPPQDRIEYPNLMNRHQKTQGYRPSQDSMFNQTWTTVYRDHSEQRENYHPLPQPPSQPPYSGPPLSAPPPPIPSETKPTASASPPETHNGLKIVHLPRDCLHRFLTIAKVNTARDRETCGLLLGRDHGRRFVVTTLLIPKQHATSDTCTMDEEELILQVTEERGLITLGWIHTHPSQSCFMSSVDLHTHSGFQRMLPESFAVVCAPSSVPNFEAFHPHPDAPIYTDAERGHVQMKDINLEIVDLR